MFRPNMFFLLLLPPIIFESGYSLHKGNFFQNIGSITLFAVFGTAISAFVVGGGIYFLGQADVISKLNMTDSFAFGSLISAVDPVATIAIFNALHVDPVLNMLVFGESILNDAVSIVLTNTAEGLTRKNMSDVSGWQTFLQALGYFLKMFFGSAALGTLTGLISALVLKHIDLRKTPSLEFGMMIIFAYLPYGLAEGISLSGIMAILFSGIVMSHYTHHNLSPVTQILMQQTLRTVAFLCATAVMGCKSPVGQRQSAAALGGILNAQEETFIYKVLVSRSGDKHVCLHFLACPFLVFLTSLKFPLSSGA